MEKKLWKEQKRRNTTAKHNSFEPFQSVQKSTENKIKNEYKHDFELSVLNF